MSADELEKKISSMYLSDEFDTNETFRNNLIQLYKTYLKDKYENLDNYLCDFAVAEFNEVIKTVDECEKFNYIIEIVKYNIEEKHDCYILIPTIIKYYCTEIKLIINPEFNDRYQITYWSKDQFDKRNFRQIFLTKNNNSKINFNALLKLNEINLIDDNSFKGNMFLLLIR